MFVQSEWIRECKYLAEFFSRVVKNAFSKSRRTFCAEKKITEKYILKLFLDLGLRVIIHLAKSLQQVYGNEILGFTNILLRDVIFFFLRWKKTCWRIISAVKTYR